MERSYPPLPGRFLLNAVSLLAMGLLALIALPLLGSSVVGLVLVALASRQETGAEGLLWLARIAFCVAVLVASAGLSVWWQTRRRSVVGVALAAITAIASAATYVLLLVLDQPAMPWLSVLVIGAGTLGLADLVLELVSKPEGRSKRRKPPRRGPKSSDKRHRAGVARDRLLDVLIHRRLVDVDEGDRIRLREMPLGTGPSSTDSMSGSGVGFSSIATSAGASSMRRTSRCANRSGRR
ncbi:hypothetical protein ACIRON_27070 [Nocardioides sp. NPDC101246]|uniref:hypothetical protein n=1 Tax=Nocardioides sp. NPDC101246 TaxID=3364336 RepID=UPI003823344D